MGLELTGADLGHTKAADGNTFGTASENSVRNINNDAVRSLDTCDLWRERTAGEDLDAQALVAGDHFNVAHHYRAGLAECRTRAQKPQHGCQRALRKPGHQPHTDEDLSGTIHPPTMAR